MDINVDTSKATNLPGAVPSACPKCERPFSRVVKPKRRLQPKAKSLIAAGVAVSLLIAPAVYYGLLIVMAGVADALGMHRLPFGLLIRGVVTLFVSAIPAYCTSVWALGFPRTVDRNGAACGWAGTFVVGKHGKIISE